MISVAKIVARPELRKSIIGVLTADDVQVELVHGVTVLVFTAFAPVVG